MNFVQNLAYDFCTKTLRLDKLSILKQNSWPLDRVAALGLNTTKLFVFIFEQLEYSYKYSH
jgi:hypothetical protein